MMAPAADRSEDNLALAVRDTILARPATPERRMADAVRVLALDAAAPVQAGHSVLPLAMADAATVLWTRFHSYDAADPHWPDRDRFVLSAGQCGLLLCALLHLTGHDGMGIAELQRFRQPHAAGHPDGGLHPAIEAAAGPAGQGLASAVGMALAERLLAARFGRSLVDHRSWVIASDSDLMAGISHEAASLAGQLRLEKLTVLWDDGGVASDGEPAPAGADDQLRRFAACGWAVKRVDGHDAGQVAGALSMALRSKKPTLIACRTAAHPGTAPAARAALGWQHPPFVVPQGLAEQWHAAGARGARRRRGWLRRLARHPQRGEFERVMAGQLPAQFHDTLAALRAELTASRLHLATSAASERVLEALAPTLPELVGGAATALGANRGQPRGMASVGPGSYGGRHVQYGSREHGMAAAMNGIALHGGVIPYGATALMGSDAMRPALRLAALAGRRVIHVLTQDSAGPGEDGAVFQPVEHLAGLRAMPDLCVFRPADALETAECWELALRRSDGPSLLVLSRQDVPPLRTNCGENRSARGGYVLAEAEGPRWATLIATGPEVALAVAARAVLAAEGVAVAVVSLPCWGLFARQDGAWRDSVLGGAPRVGVEAAGRFGWERWLGPDGLFIGIDRFAAAAPGEATGMTAGAVADAVRRRLGR